jgi:N-methylhydantoinase A
VKEAVKQLGAYFDKRLTQFDLPVAADGDLEAAFHAAHRARYGFSLEREVELVTLRARGIGVTERVPPPAPPREDGPAELGRLTSRWDGRDYDTPILSRARLPDGMRIAGPALIVEYSATTYVAPGAGAEVDGIRLRIHVS